MLCGSSSPSEKLLLYRTEGQVGSVSVKEVQSKVRVCYPQLCWILMFKTVYKHLENLFSTTSG